MRLETAYLNPYLEWFDAYFDESAAAEIAAVSAPYNRQLGPVVALSVHRPEPPDLPLVSSSCRHSPVSALMRDLAARPATGEGPTIPGGGKGRTLGAAVRGALGETSERLLAILHYQAAAPRLVPATFADLQRGGRVALGPERLPLFAPEQYARDPGRWAPFTADTPLRWIAGRALLSGEPVLVPAQLVFLYYERAQVEPPIGYPTTGGLGFHPDRRRAVLHGLYEWIERDAINVGWACRLAPRRVDVDVADFLPAPLPHGLEVQVHLNSLDVPLPVLTVVAHDRRGDDRTFLGGGGAWSDRRRALKQALYEVAQCGAVLKTLERTPRRIRPDSPVDTMDDFLDATVFYGYRQNAPLLDWYEQGQRIAWQEVPSLEFGSLDEEWEFVLAWLETRGIDPIVIDFDAAWPGASAVKVLVPELTMAWVPADPYLAHPRYYELPRLLGLADRRLGFEELNRLPLPFP
jgi:ribosomal protein S12 methylthiotransferase accessory factor